MVGLLLLRSSLWPDEEEPGFWLWLATNALHVSVYWALALPLALGLDLRASASVLTGFKIQPRANRPLSPRTWRRVVRTVLFNQLVVGENTASQPAASTAVAATRGSG